ncbi:MAG: hypothetical protein M1828_001795 [Chrysothrix sp. TS-e1954]|nr:MAG: hypothetical protein M1828_001795 [Chrysothrix sp. TS-e1954]
MVDRISTLIRSGEEAIDLQKWYMFLTFDIISALSFGDDFECLKNGQYHEYVGQLVYSIKAKVQIAACRFYPPLFKLLMLLVSKPAKKQLAYHQAVTKERVQKRLHTQVDRPDFIAYLKSSKSEMSEAEIELNAGTMIVAGTHKLQTGMTCTTRRLLQNSAALRRVTQEVRNAFQSKDEINYRSLQSLPYLNAVIHEGMRLTSPVPLGLTRMIPTGGAVICVVANVFQRTILSYQSWGANTLAANWVKPNDFVPERWLEAKDAEPRNLCANDFGKDKKEAFSPYLQGPRNCIRQNLANVELLLVIARMVYHFNMSAPKGKEKLFKWEDQETYAI